MLLLLACVAAPALLAPAQPPSTAAFGARWTSLSDPVDNRTGTAKRCGADGQSRCSRDSMPLGSGRTAVNAWVDPLGIAFYIKDGRALDEYHALHVLGMLQVHLSPNPFAAGRLIRFEQRLDHERGVMCVSALDVQGRNTTMELWADRTDHSVRLKVDASQPLNLSLALFLWRTNTRFDAKSPEVANARYGDCGDAYSHGDTVEQLPGGRGLRWGWRANASESVFGRSLAQQGLADVARLVVDPLTNLTAGAAVFGTADGVPLRVLRPAAGVGVRTNGEGVYGQLTAGTMASAFELTTVPLVGTEWSSTETWAATLDAAVKTAAAVPYAAALAAHERAWAKDWAQSWVVVGGTQDRAGTEAWNVTQALVLGRYLDLCQGSGPWPIKWQGGLFHYDSPPSNENIDSHGWGGAYWIWEMRYSYYAMQTAGDVAMLAPFFDMFLAQLPLVKARTKRLYGHGGGIFVETHYIWGAPVMNNFAENCNHTVATPGNSCGPLDPSKPIDSTCDTENPFIRHFFSGSLEVCVLALRQWEHTLQPAHATAVLLPLSDAVLDFYYAHWSWALFNGTAHLLNGSGCESWPRCDDPAPDIAGLTVLLEGLLQLPPAMSVHSSLGVARWSSMLAALPPLPGTCLRDSAGNCVPGTVGSVQPCAASHAPQIEGCEGVNVYTVWPFQLFGKLTQTAVQAKKFPPAAGNATFRSGPACLTSNAIPGQQ
jgi:hypothetical protein